MTDYATLIDAETWAFIERTNSYYPPDTIDYTHREQRADLRPHVPGVLRRLSRGRDGANDRRSPLPDRDDPDPHLPHRRAEAGRRWCSISTAAASSSAASTATTMSAPSFARAPATRSSRSTTGWRRSTCIPPLSTMRWRHSNGRRTPTQRPILLAGDSAGGNLAAAVSHATRGHARAPIGQVLIYPGLGGDASRGSYVDARRGADADAARPRLLQGHPHRRRGLFRRPHAITRSPTPTFRGLPPTVIVTAECDPLSSDGETYRDRILAAGGKAWWYEEPGLVHGYLRGRHMITRAADSFSRIVEAVSALGKAI